MKIQLNSVTLQGRLGAHPEIKTFENGKSVSRVSLAVEDNYKDSEGNWVNNTHWFRLVFWNKTIEVLQDLMKGDKIIVTGKFTTDSYVDKDEKTVNIVEIVVNGVGLVEKAKPKNTEEEEK